MINFLACLEDDRIAFKCAAYAHFITALSINRYF